MCSARSIKSIYYVKLYSRKSLLKFTHFLYMFRPNCLLYKDSYTWVKILRVSNELVCKRKRTLSKSMNRSTMCLGGAPRRSLSTDGRIRIIHEFTRHKPADLPCRTRKIYTHHLINIYQNYWTEIMIMIE